MNPATWPAWAEADNDRLWEYWKAGMSEAEAKRANYAALCADLLDTDVMLILQGGSPWVGTYAEAKVNLALALYDLQQAVLDALRPVCEPICRWLERTLRGGSRP